MPIKNKPPEQGMDEIKHGIIQDIAELLDLHEDEYSGLLENSDDKSVVLTLKVVIDKSDTATKSDVGIAFGKRWSDKRERSYGDPNQPDLPLDGDDGEETFRGVGGQGDDSPVVVSGIPSEEAAKPKRSHKKKK